MSDERLNELENRLAKLEGAIENSDGVNRIELAEATFKTVLDADYHLDDKASRILSAMAFFTAAAAAIFAKAYSATTTQDELRSRVASGIAPFTVQGASSAAVVESVINSVQRPTAQILGYDLSLLAFLGYMFSAIVSAGFYLAALGPSLNRPSKWLASTKTIRSRLFYDFIAQVDEAVWNEQWTSASAPMPSLLQEFQNNYVFESRLLAEKARAKYLWLSFGGLFLRLALLCLVVLSTSLFTSQARTVGWVSMLGCALLFAVFIFQNVTKTRKPKLRDLTSLWTACLISATLLLISFSILVRSNVRLNVFYAVLVFSAALVASLRVLDHMTRNPIHDEFSASWVIGTLTLLMIGTLLLIR
jgi:preprotein translocase subunit Sss1